MLKSEQKQQQKLGTQPIFTSSMCILLADMCFQAFPVYLLLNNSEVFFNMELHRKIN